VKISSPRISANLILVCVSAALFFSACGQGPGKQDEVLYVTAAPQAALRDRVAPVYSKTGTVRNGDKVVVLERGKRWERVRNEKGEEGWLQDRYLVGEDVFRGFQQLNRDHQNDPVQAHGILRNDFRLHLTPGRDTDRLFLLKEGEKIDLLQRATVSRAASSAPPPPLLQASASSTAEKSEEKQDASDAAKEDDTEYKSKEQPAAPAAIGKATSLTKKGPKAKAQSTAETQPIVPAVPMEDWWLVRTSQGHTGWVLGRMIDIDVPLDIAQYAEGQRIVSFFPLTIVHDAELNKDEPYYLVLLTEPKDGMPFDFNQVRVFSWNVKKHRYETAYRDRNIFGLLPVSVGQERFENLGTEPTFTIHVRDENGNTAAQKYRLEGVIVKRVLAPGETPVKAAPANPESKGKVKRRTK
jgi:SH3-like domain-containing protein